METEKFFNVLFGSQISTCFSPNIFGTKVKSAPGPDDIFFSINSLNGNGRRDSNVISFRNFLLESDSIPLENQIDYITSKVPVSTIVYSGGKSYHHIISLEEPVTKEEYFDLSKRLLNFIPNLDRSTKNPSRFSRMPNVRRPDTGAMQELVYVGNRIPNEELIKLLPSCPTANQKYVNSNKGLVAISIWRMANNPDDSISTVGLGGRNAFFYWLGQRLKEIGADNETRHEIVLRAYNSLKDTNDFSLQEAKHSARI